MLTYCYLTLSLSLWLTLALSLVHFGLLFLSFALSDSFWISLEHIFGSITALVKRKCFMVSHLQALLKSWEKISFLRQVKVAAAWVLKKIDWLWCTPQWLFGSFVLILYHSLVMLSISPISTVIFPKSETAMLSRTGEFWISPVSNTEWLSPCVRYCGIKQHK